MRDGSLTRRERRAWRSIAAANDEPPYSHLMLKLAKIVGYALGFVIGIGGGLCVAALVILALVKVVEAV